MRLRANTKSPAALEMIAETQERDRKAFALVAAEGIPFDLAWAKVLDEEMKEMKPRHEPFQVPI